MEFMGTIYHENFDLPCGDFTVHVCYEKKAHIKYGPGVDGCHLDGIAWSVGPCDGGCDKRPEKITGRMAEDLAAFLKDGKPRSGTTVPPRQQGE